MSEVPSSRFMGTLQDMLWDMETRRTRKKQVASIHRRRHEEDNNGHTSELSSVRDNPCDEASNVIQTIVSDKRNPKKRKGEEKCRQNGAKYKEGNRKTAVRP